MVGEFGDFDVGGDALGRDGYAAGEGQCRQCEQYEQSYSFHRFIPGIYQRARGDLEILKIYHTTMSSNCQSDCGYLLLDARYFEVIIAFRSIQFEDTSELLKGSGFVDIVFLRSGNGRLDDGY